MLSVTALHAGDPDAAQDYLERSVGVSRAASDIWNLGMALNALGDIARLRGQSSRAAGLYAEALGLPRVPGLVGTYAIMLTNVAHLAHQDGDDLRAANLFAEALPDLQIHGRAGDIIGCLIGVAGVSLGLRRTDRAAQLFGAVEAGLERSGERIRPSNRPEYERDLRATQLALGESRFREACQSGRAMGLDGGVRTALDLLAEFINTPRTESAVGRRMHYATRRRADAARA
jgi:hypothetical protein